MSHLPVKFKKNDFYHIIENNLNKSLSLLINTKSK